MSRKKYYFGEKILPGTITQDGKITKQMEINLSCAHSINPAAFSFPLMNPHKNTGIKYHRNVIRERHP